jgi:hypothetical protein
MPRIRFSTSGLSIAFAMGLALWEVYFFWFAGQHAMGSLEGRAGIFTPDRLGFNLAWLAFAYLTFQLISIPFALPAGKDRFMGVIDGMASLVPLAIVIVVLFGKSDLLGTAQRVEAAWLLLFVNAADLFGGYAFNIALSRRVFDVNPASTV